MGAEPRFLFNQGAAGVVYQQPNLGQGGFKTHVETTTITTTVYNTTNCIPQSLLVQGVGRCQRRRRDIEALLNYNVAEQNQFASDVEPTVIQT